MDPRDREETVRVRIAPSPTGNCHVGTARNALYNLLFARQRGGTFILRIDDTDQKRNTQESEEGVLEGLQWLGLQWDEGPGVGGPYGPYRPSERVELYHVYTQRLIDTGHAYRCFCTPDELDKERQEARAAGLPYRYGGRCRKLTPAQVRDKVRVGQPSVVRLRIVPERMAYVDLVQGAIEQDAALIGDPIIQRTSGMPTYSFATVVDEIGMHISHVLRSADHISNTFLQLQIYRALGAEPPAFAHYGLLLNEDRSKISKRAGAVYVGQFREMGYLPEAVINHLALSGWNPGTEQEIWSYDDLLQAFSLDRCGKANAIFDYPKLLWMNGTYIRRLTVDDLTDRIIPFLAEAGLLDPNALDTAARARLVSLVALEQERLKTLADAPDVLGFFYRDPDVDVCVDLLQHNRYAKRHPLPALHQALGQARAALGAVAQNAWSVEHLEQALDAQVAQLGWKRGELLMPVRIAVSGREATPPLYETVVCLGREATLSRLESVVSHLPAA